MPDDSPALDVVGLGKAYRGVEVFSDLSLTVPRGGICAIVGANGAGKSTLLECIAGATRFETGALYIGGKACDTSSSAHWASVLAILDDFTWLPELTVADHLMLMTESADVAAVSNALASFGISALHDRLPESLSSGQLQRAALATMMVRPWSVLLLDEPDRHLDTDGITTLAAELKSATHSNRCALVATHSSELITQLNCAVVGLPAGARA